VVADPGQAPFYARSARFIRIEKAVEIPDKTVRKINASAFGPAGMGMREIFGICPHRAGWLGADSGAANVPFTIEVLDKNARRIGAQHTSWLQVIPGETKQCNGCPLRHSQDLAWPLGLSGRGQSRRPHTGSPSRNHRALFANQGETMAQTQSRISCAKAAARPARSGLNSDVHLHGCLDPGCRLPARENRRTHHLSVRGNRRFERIAATNANCVPWSAQCRITIPLRVCRRRPASRISCKPCGAWHPGYRGGRVTTSPARMPHTIARRGAGPAASWI